MRRLQHRLAPGQLLQQRRDGMMGQSNVGPICTHVTPSTIRVVIDRGVP
jgi:hypothetical protein